jgi:hypothetical protein
VVLPIFLFTKGEKRVEPALFDGAAVESLAQSVDQNISKDSSMSAKGQSMVSGITTRRRAAAVAANTKPDTRNREAGEGYERPPEVEPTAAAAAPAAVEGAVAPQEEEVEEHGQVADVDVGEVAVEEEVAPLQKLSTSEEDTAAPATASAGEGELGEGVAATSSGTAFPMKRKGLSGLKARLAKPKARRLDSDADLVTAAVVAQAQVAAAAAQQAELYRRNPAEDASRADAAATSVEPTPVEVATGASPSSSSAPRGAEGTNTNTRAADTDSNAGAGDARAGEDDGLTVTDSGRGRGRGRSRGRGRGRGRKSVASQSAEGGTEGGRSTGTGIRGRRGSRGGRGRGRGRAVSLSSLARDESVEAPEFRTEEGGQDFQEEDPSLYAMNPEADDDGGPESSGGPSEKVYPYP